MICAVIPLHPGRMTEDRVQWMLWNWAQFMHSGKSAHLRAKTSGFWAADGHRTSDEMLVPIDKRCAAATWAAICDLEPNYKAAIEVMHIERENWPLPEAALPLYYRAACTEIGRKLDRRGIV